MQIFGLIGFFIVNGLNDAIYYFNEEIIIFLSLTFFFCIVIYFANKNVTFYFLSDVKLIYLIILFACWINVNLCSQSKYLVSFNVINGLYSYLNEYIIFNFNLLKILEICQVKFFGGMRNTLFLYIIGCSLNSGFNNFALKFIGSFAYLIKDSSLLIMNGSSYNLNLSYVS